MKNTRRPQPPATTASATGPVGNSLRREAVRSAALSLATAIGPALVTILQWWTHSR